MTLQIKMRRHSPVQKYVFISQALVLLMFSTLNSLSDADNKIQATADGVEGGISVLRCRTSSIVNTMEYIFWYVYEARNNLRIIYYDERSWNQTYWAPGKVGPFENRYIAGTFGDNYVSHKLRICGTKQSDNKTYMCVVKMAGIEDEKYSKVHLFVKIPSDKEPAILDDTNQPIKLSDCSSLKPVHQVAADSISLTCRGGGSMPAPKVTWVSIHSGDNLHFPKTLSYRSNKRWKQEVTLGIELKVTRSTRRAECVVEEPDPSSGEQRKVHMCFSLVKVDSEQATADGFSQRQTAVYGLSAPVLATLFILVPMIG